jgi:hypothetical protein
MQSSFVSRCTIAIAAVVLFTSACSDSSTEPKQNRPTDVEVLFGEDQAGPAGTQLPNPIVVGVLDAEGNPVPNTPISFVVVAGDGSVQDATPRTDELGLALVRWTLGPSMHAEQRLEARAGSAVATILATAGPGAPARLEIVPPTQGANVYPGARVLDQFGNPVPGVTVAFKVIAGGGTLEGETVESNALGVALVGRWNLGAPGANTIQASVGTLTPVTYTINQLDRTPARVILSAGQGQTAVVGTNVPVPPSVIVQNNTGIALSDVVVTFTPGTNSGNVSITTVTTGMNGMATLGGWTLGPVVGEQTLVASAGPTATFTFTAQGTPDRVGRLEKHAGDEQITTPGGTVATPPGVKVLDVHGNAVPGITVTFDVYNGGGSRTGGSAVSDAQGIATVGSWTLGPIAGTQTLSASAEGASDVYFTAQAATGAATLIKAHPDNPTEALLGAEVTLSVIVVDDIDRPKAGVPITFAALTSPHFPPGTVLAPYENVMTNAQGVASVRYVMPDQIHGPGGVSASGAGMPTLQVTVVPMSPP